jgi:hypothetical protein
MAIAASGAAVLDTVRHAGDPLPETVRWLLVGSVASIMVTVTALTLILEARQTYEPVYLVAERALLIGAAIALVVGFTNWDAKTSLIAMVVLLLGTIYTGMRVWVRMTPTEAVDERV